MDKGRQLETLVSAKDWKAPRLSKGSRRARSDSATREYCPASRRSKVQTSFPAECGRFAFSSGGQRSRQNEPPAPECPCGVRATGAAGSETHPDGSTGHCEI